MTIFGWDMSHFDSPNIGAAVREGISFITHKAGGDANDQELGSWWNNVRNLPEPVILGAYWVLYPGNPEARADAFLARLDSQCPGWRDRDVFILQVDAEKWNGQQGTVPGKTDLKQFCDRLAAKTSCRPIVYAPKWVYGDSLTGLGYPLWASSYVSSAGAFKAIYPGDSSAKWNAYSGQTPTILQYSSSAIIGGQGTSDANAFRGTVAELKTLISQKKGQDVATLDSDDKAAIQQAAAEAVVGFFRAAWEAATGAAPADTQLDRNKRAYLLFLRAAVGGPVDQSALLAAIMQENNVTAGDIAVALAPLIHIPDGSGMTSDDVVKAVKQALREGTTAP